MYDVPNGGEYRGLPLGSSVSRLADREKTVAVTVYVSGVCNRQGRVACY